MIKYSAPSVRGRQIFGEGGQLSHDPHYPVWRAGANSATALHTDAELDIRGLKVPPGDYTLFVNVADPDKWELIVSKDTKEWGLAYKDKWIWAGEDGHEQAIRPDRGLQITLTGTGGNAGMLQMEWEKHIATVPFK